MLIDTNYDVLAADMYFHQAYCNRFTYEYQKKSSVTSFTKLLFYTTFFVKLNNKDHEAFLVNELMPNIQEISEKHGLKQPQAELRLRIETERKTSRSFSL